MSNSEYSESIDDHISDSYSSDFTERLSPSSLSSDSEAGEILPRRKRKFPSRKGGENSKGEFPPKYIKKSIKEESTGNTPVLDEEEIKSVVKVQCKNLEKGPEKGVLTYDISVPKNCGNLVIFLRRRNLKTTTLFCTFESQLIQQSSTELIVQN